MLQILKPSRISRLLHSTTTRRLYHSTDHTGTNTIINPQLIESKILTKAIDYIPEYGFEPRTITKAIHELQYPDSLISVLTSSPSGYSLSMQLMLHWLKSKRQELETFANGNIEGGGEAGAAFGASAGISTEGDKLKQLIKYRLLLNNPIKSKLSQGLSQLVVPYNLSASIEELLNLGDDLAYYAGDKSNDFAWYSKRATICSIYVKSELFSLNDDTADLWLTNQFVDERVDDYVKLGQGYNNVEQWIDFNAVSVINLIKSQLARG
ncbi:coq9 [Candida theae]|uniref:Ubiquinone biosynthesis protein n=1 Tax=Candida theae TaxID=1198502 RepID=A0AAD5BE28_9ASCO|nr:coq9 [Candida theae]KAI5957859.1 coq9 [Candida theae]